MSAAPLALPAANEAAFARRWAAGVRGLQRTADGRRLKVVFPGVPGGGSGPDFRDAMVDIGGDLLRGEIELHLRASGWRAHGHQRDPAYARVVLHVVERNDGAGLSTNHESGRSIALLVLPPEPGQAPFPPPFTPPCALRTAQGLDAGPILGRLGLRRLRTKAARLRPLAERIGGGPALYAVLLEYVASPANRPAFAQLAARLPLTALIDRCAGAPDHGRAVAAELRGAAAALSLGRAGSRPMADPRRRLEAAAALLARLWPAGSAPVWPLALAAGADLLGALTVPGAGRSLAIELAANAVLPCALASAAWSEAAVEAAFASLPSPGAYGLLKPLGGWLSEGGQKPFSGAQRLQGGLLLHTEYCARGACGRCPMSE